MTETERARRERFLAEADRLADEGDHDSARIVLDVVAYGDRYRRA